MPIEFHCPACGKGIRAPDAAGGKYGKCPYCGVSAYIPLPSTELDVIPLAPVDSKTEQMRERLRRESISYAAQVDHDQPAKYDVGPSDKSKRPPAGGAAPRDDETIDVHELVEQYVLAMCDSNLTEGERIATRLKRRREQTVEYVEGLLLDQIGLNVKGVRKEVVRGFLKSLLERLG